MSNGYTITPQPHNVKDKYDVLDWDELPTQPCDMNYRLSSGPRLGPTLDTAIFLALIALGAGLAYMALTWTRPWWSMVVVYGEHLGVVSILSAGALVILGRKKKDLIAGALLPVAMLVGWTVLLIATGWLDMPTRLGILLLAAPIACVVATDQIASHGVHWFTAHP